MPSNRLHEFSEGDKDFTRKHIFKISFDNYKQIEMDHPKVQHVMSVTISGMENQAKIGQSFDKTKDCALFGGQ